jgi:hypothetical protein
MEITTKFYDENLEPIDPLTIVGRCGNIDGILHYDSVYLIPKVSLQLKVWETIFRPIAGGDNPSVLLKREKPKPLARPQQSVDDDTKVESSPEEENEERNEDAGSVKAEEDDEEESAPTPPPKPAVKPVVKAAPPRTIVASKTAPKVVKKAAP